MRGLSSRQRARIAFCWLPPLRRPIAAWALLPFLGFTLYAPFSSLVVLGQQYLAKNIGFASGVTLGLATSLGGVMAPLLGWIADHQGLPRAFQFLAAVALLGAVFAYTLKPVAKKEQTA